MLNNLKGNAMIAVGGLVAIMLAVAFLVLAPIFVIWALNMLFPILAIPYSFETWCAVIVLAKTITLLF